MSDVDWVFFIGSYSVCISFFISFIFCMSLDGLNSPLKKDEDVRWGSRARDKPLSLTERLRMEFGLDDSDEEESSPGEFI